MRQTHAGPGWRQRADEDQYAASVAVIVALGGRTTLAESEALTASAGRGLPAEDGFRTAALFLRGVALTLGRDMDRGRQCLVEAGRLGRVLDVPTMEADALSWRGVLAMAEGDHRAAQGFINSAADLIRDTAWNAWRPPRTASPRRRWCRHCATTPAPPRRLPPPDG